MKKTVTILFLSLVCIAGFGLSSAANAFKGEITVIIEGLKNNIGEIRVSMHHSEKGFPEDEGIFKLKSSITNLKTKVVFKNVPKGVYAIAFFHDENLNEKMDTDWFGHPKEGYGASNDARSNFGPPEWEDAKFLFDSERKTLKLTVEY